MYTGKKVTRVDAYDKVIGRTKYANDLCDKSAYIIQILHASIAHGKVKSIDTSQAEKIPGVVKIFTCFDVKEKHYFATAGHPWSTDPDHQDIADRLVLTQDVRFYGDDIAAVAAEDETTAAQALRAIKVEYETYPFVLDMQEAMKDDAPQLHKNYPNNILKHTQIRKGNYEEAIKELGLTKVEGWYDTPVVQHCHIENFICFAQMEGARIPQAMWAVECHTQDVAAKMGIDPIDFRRKTLMPKGFTDPFSKNELYYDTFNQCLDKVMAEIGYEQKCRQYQNQTGEIRRGIGAAVFWYNTAVWPISLETSSCRMVLNQDGSLQVQLGETEIGQGADTAYTQMAADVHRRLCHP